MATGCQVRDCQRLASAFCFCCKNNVCTSHFLGHIERIKAKIDPLANEVNSTMERIQNLTIDQLSRPISAELHRWQKDMHESIDQTHRIKTKEIEEILKTNTMVFDKHKLRQVQTVMKIQEDVRQLAEGGDVTFERIESFQNQLRMIETDLVDLERSFLSIDTRVLCESLVRISSEVNESLQLDNSRQKLRKWKGILFLFPEENRLRLVSRATSILQGEGLIP